MSDTVATTRELKRLLSLPCHELLAAYTDAKEHFHDYLRAHGIEPPGLLLNAMPLPPDADPASSVFIDEFSVANVEALDDSIDTVYCTVALALVLFTLLPSSPNVGGIHVTVSGKVPCPLVRIRDQQKEGTVKDETVVSMPASEIRALIPEIREAWKNAPESVRLKDKKKEDKAQLCPSDQIEITDAILSPFITLSEYCKLFPEGTHVDSSQVSVQDDIDRLFSDSPNDSAGENADNADNSDAVVEPELVNSDAMPESVDPARLEPKPAKNLDEITFLK